MLHRISANYARVIANAARLPFKSASYGVESWHSSCSTCPSVDTALRELRRLLLAGGSIRPTTCGYDSGSPALEYLESGTRLHGRNCPDFSHPIRRACGKNAAYKTRIAGAVPERESCDEENGETGRWIEMRDWRRQAALVLRYSFRVAGQFRGRLFPSNLRRLGSTT